MMDNVPFVPIDDLDIDIEKKGGGLRCKLEYEVRCENVYKVSGTDKLIEFENADIRHRIVQGLRDSLLEVVPQEIMRSGLNTRIRDIIAHALTSEAYLMQVCNFLPLEKQGSPLLYPPDGRYLDVTLEIDDEWDFLIVDSNTIRFVIDPSKRTSPRRLLFASGIKQSEYGYLPAKQGKDGIKIAKDECPKPKASPKVVGKFVYCMVVNPEGFVPDRVECPGFGGFSDGTTVCRYLRKMVARKQSSGRTLLIETKSSSGE